MKGWYTLEIGVPSVHSGQGVDGIPTPVFLDFLGLYLEDRLGSRWCLSAETSLLFRLDSEAIPDRIIALTEYGSTTHHRFGGLTELTVYRDPDRFPPQNTTWAGLRLMSPEDALCRLKPSALERDPQLIRRALPLVRNWRSFAETLAREGRATAAARLHAELESAGQDGDAALLRSVLAAGGLPIDARPAAADRTSADPGMSPPDLTALWTSWSADLAANPTVAATAPSGLLELLSHAQEMATDDALASLRISGYTLSRGQILSAMSEPERAATAAGWPELADQERNLPDGHQDALPGEADPQALLALQGYVETGRLVKRSIVRLLEDEPLSDVLTQDLPGWHQALLLPSCEAGLVPESELGKTRPTASGRSPGSMETRLKELWELAEQQPDPNHRALLVHLAVLQMRPWGAGNGRLARFLFNALRMAGRRHWLVIDAEKSGEYGEHVAAALAGHSLRPLAKILAV